MQGKKHHQPKLFTTFQLADRVPLNSFYRRLKDVLDLRYLYKETNIYYGSCGQKSVDPVVFFKLCLVGYLENIISDRKLIEHCSMRLDILYFLDYDIDEELPWHSTISRTRQLFPEEVFETVFEHIFSMCVDKGMVAGTTQVIDSAPVKANASMDSLELKVPEEELTTHLAKIRHISQMDKMTYRKAKENKASKEQQTIRASDRELKQIKSRNKKWSTDQDQRVGANNKNAKYTSNKTHYSPTDPDARISVKPGKARKLNYQSQLAVDTSHHVISHIGASYADLKDNQCLQDVVRKLQPRLKEQELYWENLLADAGYSSGENYAFLEREHLTGYIPAHGTYKGGPKDFTYDQDNDSWICPQGKVARYRKLQIERKNFNRKRVYSTHPKDCRDCPIAAMCKGVSNAKRFTITYYKAEYDRMIARLHSQQGRRMKSKRQSTVEPVFGTLTQFMGLRKVNTIGIKQANKVMLLAGVAYNIKKYLKFTQNRAQSMGKEMKEVALHFLMKYGFKPSALRLRNYQC